VCVCVCVCVVVVGGGGGQPAAAASCLGLPAAALLCWPSSGTSAVTDVAQAARIKRAACWPDWRRTPVYLTLRPASCGGSAYLRAASLASLLIAAASRLCRAAGAQPARIQVVV
jgi:hypothetical protein